MVCWDNSIEILQLSVFGWGQRHAKKQLAFCRTDYLSLCHQYLQQKLIMFTVRLDLWGILYVQRNI
jgi:hypothetical protein